MSGWMIRGRVRIVADVKVGNVDPGRHRQYRAGEELTMILRGQEGEPLSAASWWSSLDVDGAYILKADDVEVLEMLGPYWVTCGGCGAGGQIEEENERAYLDVEGRIARQQRTSKPAKGLGVESR
ncbi:hypothetical protein ACIQ9Q_29485 [Streptomyces sp. NPDC094438]|uniref:hypothetical protein n=1 Tax=Streptomyces sp. NPDC094438 TaxID=3366061 RepID=UPI0037F1D30F